MQKQREENQQSHKLGKQRSALMLVHIRFIRLLEQHFLYVVLNKPFILKISTSIFQALYTLN